MQLEHWQQTLAASLEQADADTASPWPAAALDVHRRNMRGACMEALSTTYPVLKTVLGARYFARLVHEFDYAAADLNFAGRAFPAWLEQTAADREELTAMPYLADLARLEWLLHSAYYAPDDPVMNTHSFQQAMQDPAGWRLRLSASLSLLASPWPVAAIWRTNRGSRPLAELRARPCHVAVWRKNSRARLASLAADHWRLLQAAQTGASIDALAAQGMTADTMSRFLQRGWVTGASSLR